MASKNCEKVATTSRKRCVTMKKGAADTEKYCDDWYTPFQTKMREIKHAKETRNFKS